MSGANKHPYHLVEPSPWPAVGSAAAAPLIPGDVPPTCFASQTPMVPITHGLNQYCRLSWTSAAAVGRPVFFLIRLLHPAAYLFEQTRRTTHTSTTAVPNTGVVAARATGPLTAR